MKTYFRDDIKGFEKDNKSRLDRLETLHTNYYDIIESQSQSLDKQWGDNIKGIQAELSKGNEEIKKKTNQVKNQLHDGVANWEDEVRKQNEYKAEIKNKTGKTYH